VIIIREFACTDDQSSILLSIAEQYSVPPSILARLMLRKYLLKKPSTCENSAESDSINMKEGKYYY